MTLSRILLLFVSLGYLMIVGNNAAAEDKWPAPADLPVVKDLPDPLVMFDGSKVETKDDWFNRRRPELKQLFGHYMYGHMPDAPGNLKFKVESVDANYFNGKATKKELTITFGPDGTPPIRLLLTIPNQREGAVPVVLGLNFGGNHALLKDPSIALTQAWMPNRFEGVKNNKATEESRGTRAGRFDFEYAAERGYAVATFYHGDVDPDVNDFTNGVHPHFHPTGKEKHGPHDWAAIAAWAWGLSRVVDYLEQDDQIDNDRVIVYGHSRNGKTALLCGAFDERVDLIIPHQAGCGGTSPSRSPVGEQLKQINDRFPHWFCTTFHQFNDMPERLPFDQHSLIALCAPRPVLLTNAEGDQWADPSGQFDALAAADKVYRFVGAPGLEADKQPPLNQPVLSHLGYYIRPGKHSVTRDDWKVFLDFADANLK